MSDRKENVLDRLKEMNERIEKAERRFVSEKQGFRRSVAEAPIYSMAVGVGGGIVCGFCIGLGAYGLLFA